MRSARRAVALTVALFVLIALFAPGACATAARAVRWQWWHLDIDKAMDAVGIAPGMIVGEAGAGDGYFTLPMARRVGPKGEVYANDISSRALRSLADLARRDGLTNIRTVQGKVDDPMFPRNDLQVVVIVHAFHDFDQPVEWLVNLRKYLGPGAVVAIIDRDPAQGASRHFWSRERIAGYVSQADYKTTRVIDDISDHLIILIKPAR